MRTQSIQFSSGQVSTVSISQYRASRRLIVLLHVVNLAYKAVVQPMIITS